MSLNVHFRQGWAIIFVYSVYYNYSSKSSNRNIPAEKYHVLPFSSLGYNLKTYGEEFEDSSSACITLETIRQNIDDRSNLKMDR